MSPEPQAGTQDAPKGEMHMHVFRGYRDPQADQAKDMNVYGHPEVSGKTLPPVTRVIPDCGHTYLIPGHVPDESPLVHRLCRRCDPEHNKK